MGSDCTCLQCNRGDLHPIWRSTIGRSISEHTLWWTNIAMENGHRNSGFSHSKWWFSMAKCDSSPEGHSPEKFGRFMSNKLHPIQFSSFQWRAVCAVKSLFFFSQTNLILWYFMYVHILYIYRYAHNHYIYIDSLYTYLYLDDLHHITIFLGLIPMYVGALGWVSRLCILRSVLSLQEANGFRSFLVKWCGNCKAFN